MSAAFQNFNAEYCSIFFFVYISSVKFEIAAVCTHNN